MTRRVNTPVRKEDNRFGRYSPLCIDVLKARLIEWIIAGQKRD